MAPLAGGANAPAIAFVGFMGAGKTRAAKGASAVLGERAIDVDAEVERELGAPAHVVFEREGESRFREVEERVALEALSSGACVALGGGAVESERVRAALAESFTVWCRISEDAAWSRCEGTRRPLAQDRDEFRRRFEIRQPLYESLARAVMGDRGEEIARQAAHWFRAASMLDGSRVAWARSKSGEYPAVVGDGALGLLGRPPAEFANRWFCIADAGALAAQGSRLPGVAATVEAGGAEARKTMAEAERVLRELASAGARRDDGVLAFGGGVAGDLAGFCAATYQRGVPVVQAPTTLVAQVDSAYGGKTGVDLPEGKNYVGAYHMPAAVLAEPGALQTLPREELAAGFAEVVKTALIAGGSLWERVRQIDIADAGALEDVIFDCARTKIDVVADDERDSGRRQVLNLGHTVGHAIETATGYARFRHGEAVAIGLLAALRMSDAPELQAEVADVLMRNGLPTAIGGGVDAENVLAAIERDKKADADGVPFVLCPRPGEAITGQRVERAIVRQALEEIA